MISLHVDLIRDILGRVDGITLANAGCVSSEFSSIATQESLWEKSCCSLWPSIGDRDVKELISSSLGGFRNFYGDCFSGIVYGGDSNTLQFHDVLHSDLVWAVDVAYKNKPIYSNVVWGIPEADDFSTCPFRIKLINFSDIEYDEIYQTIEHELPTIKLSNQKQEDGKILEQLMENVRLSWILINKRTGRAANLSSWRPLVGGIVWPFDEEFVISFGSILPAHNIIPSKAVQCKLVIKCRVSDSDHTCLKITELGMELEDMMGAHVNGGNSLLILERALHCKRSKDHDRILESHQNYLTEKRKLRQTEMRASQGPLDVLLNGVLILNGIVAFALFSYIVFKESGPIF